MEIPIEALRNGDIGINAASLSFSKIHLKGHLDEENYFAVKSLNLLMKRNWLFLSQLEQYVFCITITYFCSISFRVGELNQISHAELRQIPLKRIGTLGSRNDTHN